MRNEARVSVFKGKTFKLTKAIFWILAYKQPLTIYEVYKQVRKWRELKHVKYSVVNVRMRTLEERGYVEKKGKKKTKAGFEAFLYQLTYRAYLAMILNKLNVDDFIEKADEESLISALASFISWTVNK